MLRVGAWISSTTRKSIKVSIQDQKTSRTCGFRSRLRKYLLEKTREDWWETHSGQRQLREPSSSSGRTDEPLVESRGRPRRRHGTWHCTWWSSWWPAGAQVDEPSADGRARAPRRGYRPPDPQSPSTRSTAPLYHRSCRFPCTRWIPAATARVFCWRRQGRA
jgi:hypothetical protein